MINNKLIVSTKSKAYPIYFGNKCLGITGRLIKKKLPNVKKICIISDNKVPKILLKKLTNSLKNFDLKIYKLSVNENIKSFSVANKIAEHILNNNFNRTDCIIAFGGGIVGDLSAFVSSIVKRGMKFVNIPTTLVAQADSSVGGKTGINTKNGKNLIGTFHQPEFVLIDTFMLNSLPKKEMICGYGEILKHALILDKKFFLFLSKYGRSIILKKNNIKLTEAIIKSCKIKSKIVSKDEKENGLRMILNFGHTFAHAFEGAAGFSIKINHGTAVLLGMMLAIELAYNKKILSIKDLKLIKKHYKNLNLPYKFSMYFKKNKINKIIYFMKKDKKNTNKKINLILLKKIGKTTKPNNFDIDGQKLKRFLVENYR